MEIELLGRRIRGLRKKRRLSIEKLAEKAGVSARFLGDIERGRENPSISSLIKLASALSVKMSELMKFEEELEGKALRKEMHDMIDRCDDEDVRFLLKVAVTLKD
jgi:transcriptional regulator with XRE-family HTH domain